MVLFSFSFSQHYQILRCQWILKFPDIPKRSMGIAVQKGSELISLCPVSYQILTLQMFCLLQTLGLIYLEINNVYNNSGRKLNSGQAIY